MKKIIITITLFLVAGSVLAGRDKERKIPYDVNIRSAKIYLFSSKEYDKAEEQLLEAIANYEDAVEAHFLLGTLYMDKSNFVKMKEHFQKFEEICARAEENNDKKLKKRCKKDKMKELIEQTIESAWVNNFGSGVTNLRMADSLTKELETISDDSVKTKLQGSIDKLLKRSIDDFSVAVLVDSSRFEAWTNLGLAAAKDGKPEKAIECFEQSYSLKPDDIGLVNNLAATLFNQKEYSRAATFYGKAAELDESNAANAYINQAVCYQALQDHEKAKEAFDKILEIDPDIAEIRYQRGMYFIRKASSDEIRDSSNILNDLAIANPNDKKIEQAKQDLIAHRISFYEQALPDLKAAAELQPENVDNWSWYGFSALLSNKTDIARTAFEKCVELENAPKDCWCNLAEVYARLKLRDLFDKADAECKKK